MSEIQPGDFIPADQGIPLDAKIAAEFKSQHDLCVLLASLWKVRQPQRAQTYATQFRCDLNQWKEQLIPQHVGSYIAGVSAIVRHVLLDGSTTRDNLATGTIVLPEDGSIRVELTLDPNSYAYEMRCGDTDVYDLLLNKMTHQDAPSITESELIKMAQMYSGDGLAFFGVSYVADSLRRREIPTLPSLVLQPTTNTDKILVSLNLD